MLEQQVMAPGLSPTWASLWASGPHLYPAELSLSRMSLKLVPMRRDDYRRLTFLDSESLAGLPYCTLSLDELLETCQVPAPQSRGIAYVFHTAYCCSTLLTRCLEMLDACLVLREPEPLLTLAFAKEHLVILGAVERQACLELLTALLARTFHPDQVSVVKPSAQCNTLLADLLTISPSSRAVFLYSDLETHLYQVLKSAERRALARNRAELVMPEARRLAMFTPPLVGQMTDAEAAAFVWTVRVCNYQKLAAGGLSPQLRSLNCAAFLTDPQGSLRQLNRDFALGHSDDEIGTIVNSQVMQSHSKQVPENFNAQARAACLTELRRNHSVEAREGLLWAERHCPVQLPLAQPL